MKKSVSCIAVALVALSFHSCVQTENCSVCEDVCSSDLIVKLDKFNSEFCSLYGVDRSYDCSSFSLMKTKSPDSRWTVVAADVKGAFTGAKYGSETGSMFGPHSAVVLGTVGALLVGTVASLAAYEQENSSTSTTCFIAPLQMYHIAQEADSLFMNRWTEEVGDCQTAVDADYDEIDGIGELHNAILDTLIGYGLQASGETYQADTLCQDECLTSDIFLTEGFEQCYYSTYYTNFSSSETLFDDTFDGVANDVAALFMEMLMQFAANPDCVANIVDHYAETIEDSQELSNDDKRAIYIGLRIAKASSSYWNATSE